MEDRNNLIKEQSNLFEEINKRTSKKKRQKLKEITKEFQMKGKSGRVYLGTFPTLKEDSISLWKCIEDEIDRIGIKKRGDHILTSDSANIIQKLAKDKKLLQLPCLAHVLNLTIQAASNREFSSQAKTLFSTLRKCFKSPSLVPPSIGNTR